MVFANVCSKPPAPETGAWKLKTRAWKQKFPWFPWRGNPDTASLDTDTPQQAAPSRGRPRAPPRTLALLRAGAAAVLVRVFDSWSEAFSLAPMYLIHTNGSLVSQLARHGLRLPKAMLDSTAMSIFFISTHICITLYLVLYLL